MPRIPKYLVLVSMYLCLFTKVHSQCVSGSVFWLNGLNSPGTLSDTGVIVGTDTVIVKSVGTFASLRPGYGNTGTFYWGGNPFKGLLTYRGYNLPVNSYTYFKLKSPLDSNYIHLLISDIRGDGFFNSEAQLIKGFLGGVPVGISFKDPVNGAYITGGNTVNGATTTTSTLQSSIRAFFNGPVDSIVVQQAGWTDYIIATLYARCDIILPFKTLEFYGIPGKNEIDLYWTASRETNIDTYEIDRSPDAVTWATIGQIPVDQSPVAFHSYRFTDAAPNLTGWNFYRIKSAEPDGRYTYSRIIRVSIAGSNIPCLLSVSPNPFREQLFIHYEPERGNSKQLHLRLYNIHGQLIGNWNSTQSDYSIPVKDLSPGIYVLSILDAEGKLSSFKLVKQ